MTTVITAVYGDYEVQLPDLSNQTVPVDRKILVTDTLSHGTAITSVHNQALVDGWEVVVEPRPHLHPNVAAKIPKFLPARYCDDRYVIWMDANTIAGPQLVERTLIALTGGETGVASWIAQFPHPLRDCIYDEVGASRGAPGLAKYDGQMMEEQVAQYRAVGMPEHWGLWATGVIGSRPQAQLDFRREWLEQVVLWSMQDQLSQPFLLWRHHVRPVPIARDLWCDPVNLVGFRPHGS
jgi:hypothetical protein